MVLVFKTSVETRKDVNFLTPFLNHFAGAGYWNFALDDHDRILRIVTPTVSPKHAIELLQAHGFQCVELEDQVWESELFEMSITKRVCL